MGRPGHTGQSPGRSPDHGAGHRQGPALELDAVGLALVQQVRSFDHRLGHLEPAVHRRVPGVTGDLEVLLTGTAPQTTLVGLGMAVVLAVVTGLARVGLMFAGVDPEAALIANRPAIGRGLGDPAVYCGLALLAPGTNATVGVVLWLVAARLWWSNRRLGLDHLVDHRPRLRDARSRLGHRDPRA